ncbi:MAG: hypothetical protein HS106_11440 [Ideonella sp.]|nr:hypothetical protein [Ideonella sp.]
MVQQDRVDLVHLRGHPLMFYYLALALAVAGFVLSARLLPRGRLGFYAAPSATTRRPRGPPGRHLPLQDVCAADLRRHDGAGGRVFALYYNNLFPEQIFNIGRSIEIILAPIIGGIGTLFGPVLARGGAHGAVRGHQRTAPRSRATRFRASSRSSTASRSGWRSCSGAQRHLAGDRRGGWLLAPRRGQR